MSIKVDQREDQLTHSTPFHFFCRHTNDDQYLCHYFRRYLRHSIGRWHPDVNLEPTEEAFDPAEQVDESALARVDVFDRLSPPHIKIGRTTNERKPTKRRTPIPVNIIFDGGKT